MITTLRKIKSERPCRAGWSALLNHLGKTKEDNDPLEFSTILEAVGISDAAWCLRILPYKDRCLFAADVAQSVLHYFEDVYPNDTRPKDAIEAVRLYHQGKISGLTLGKRWEEASCVAETVCTDSSTEDPDAMAAAYSAATAASSAADADADAAYATAIAAASASSYADDWNAQETKTTTLFIKHFGESTCV